MAETTAISWTDSTWNPIKGVGPNRWMCRKISPGCDHCYASTLNRRFGGEEYPNSTRRAAVGYRPGEITRASEPDDWKLDLPTLLKPLGWRTPRMIFVCSMTDLCGEWVPDRWLDAVFGVMATASRHTFQVLTKRPSRLRAYFERDTEAGAATPIVPGLPDPVRARIDAQRRDLPSDRSLPNVWCGVSVEQDRYTWRAEVLKRVPAALRFVSGEPLLGPLPSLRLEPQDDRPGIDWLIVGGESGGHADRRLVVRCTDPGPHAGHRACGGTGWSPGVSALGAVRDLRDRAAKSGTAFHFKQWGGPTHASGGRLLDGREHLDVPDPAADRRRGIAP